MGKPRRNSSQESVSLFTCRLPYGYKVRKILTKDLGALGHLLSKQKSQMKENWWPQEKDKCWIVVADARDNLIGACAVIPDIEDENTMLLSKIVFDSSRKSGPEVFHFLVDSALAIGMTLVACVDPEDSDTQLFIDNGFFRIQRHSYGGGFWYRATVWSHEKAAKKGGGFCSFLVDKKRDRYNDRVNWRSSRNCDR